jgi:protein-S-isoprenylcysteine O-methyltransferase Ste14
LAKLERFEGWTMVVSETVLILAAGTIVLAILFAGRLAMRALAGDGAVPRPDGDRGSVTSGSASTDVAGVIALPPFIFLSFLVLATVLEVVIPLPILATNATVRFVAGALFAACGFVIIGMGTRRFIAAGTNIPPNLPTTALVVDGIYARTRNPLYLGMILVYVALSTAAGSLWAILLALPLLWVINVGVIAREERYLERKFGDAYRTYRQRVGRWV